MVHPRLQRRVKCDHVLGGWHDVAQSRYGRLAMRQPGAPGDTDFHRRNARLGVGTNAALRENTETGNLWPDPHEGAIVPTIAISSLCAAVYNRISTPIARWQDLRRNADRPSGVDSDWARKEAARHACLVCGMHLYHILRTVLEADRVQLGIRARPNAQGHWCKGAVDLAQRLVRPVVPGYV